MSGVQAFFTRIFPKKWAASMEADSCNWVMRCDCGHETSVWEMGGIRWKACGRPRRFGRCAKCGKTFWGAVE